MTKIRLMGPAVEVAEVLDILRGCARLRLAAVSELLPTRRHPGGWVRAYVTAALRSQFEPCCGPLAAVHVGTAPSPDGGRHLFACRACGRTWTSPQQRPEVP